MGMKKLSAYCILLLAGCSLLSCKEKAGGASSTIDVATAFAHPTALTASDYFSKVRYVPLETTDESLIGRGADVQFFGDKLVVTTKQKQCLLFDANTGRFIRSIGHISNDPEGNSSVMFWIDQPSLTLNLQGWKGDWQQYDNQGIYKGKIHFPVERSIGDCFTYANEQTTVIYHTNIFAGASDSIFFFRNGELLKAMAANTEEEVGGSVNPADIADISVMSGDNAFDSWGPAAMNGLLILNLKEGEKRHLSFDGVTRFWHLGDELYYKNDFNDTIFQVKDMDFIPTHVFDLGAYHWPVSERYNKEQDQNIYISHILESDDLMLFRFTYRLLNTDKSETYNGMYDKRSGELKVNLLKEGITDDLTHFLPLQPRCVSHSGEYASLLQAADVTTWFEDYPDRIANLPKEVQQLQQVGEEDNPVIVFMK